MEISTSNVRNTLKNAGSILANTTADLLANSDFINRSVGMANSYEDIIFIVQALGREPISLLGKDYLYIFDHVRRNYNMGSNVMDYNSNYCPKFTFYKEKPTVRFANPYDDPKNLLDRWKPNVDFGDTSQRNILFSYAESDDDYTNNKEIGTKYDIDSANPGVNKGGISSFANVMSNCDLLKKTNDNFNHGKYRTLIARFHTNSMDSKDKSDITQTAITEKYGMSHGRNLLKVKKTEENGYENPYCRVWTYHHQYNQLSRAIRPFNEESAEMLEKAETTTGFETVGFRTVEDKTFEFDGGSKRLDKYGVLNYRNGMVNIAPTAKIKDYFEHKEDKQIPIKKCMFSIENLAWKSENIINDEYDQYGLSPEQKGPLGGRIMWFPPYDLTFNESVRVNWNSNQFIGRGEKIYTYTDTERNGNISFTLLIDHPSILDYWTGHERNGMKNQGKSLLPGNGGGVDEIDNQENTLLRFFAGCEVLTAKPQEFRTRDRKPNKTKDPEPPVKEDPVEPEVHDPSKPKAIHCVLYYPNNYSGIDDFPNTNSTVNAIYYLMNGIGAQKYVKPCKCTNPNCDFLKDNKVPYEWYPESNTDKSILSGTTTKCPICGGSAMVNLDDDDFPTQINEKINGGSNGGYEINGNISIATDNIEENPDKIAKTYADAVSSHKRAQYLTNNDSIYEIDPKDGGINSNLPKYRLAKIVGSQAMSLGAAKTPSNLSGASHLWYRRRWFYRVDKAYENSRLSTKKSYLDTSCENLNASGYKKVLEKENVAKAFGLNDSEVSTRLISFADLFVALENGADKIITDVDKDNVNIVKEIVSNPERFNITGIKFEGHASYQGYAASNDTLSKNRALTFKKWMEKKGFPKIEIATSKPRKQSPNNNPDKGDNSELTVKLWRSASVIIEYEEGNFELAATAEKVKGKVDASGNTSTDRLSVQNKEMSLTPIAPLNIGSTLPTTEDYKATFLKKGDEDLKKLSYTLKGQREGIEYFDKMSWDYDPEYHESIGQATINGIKKGTVERYDNEGEFFELLEKNDPFMHHLITDKIKYFDPAFHSISPEGFNARLTFLHQCTRQGSTVSGSDKTPGTAYNLAFGRPPICVLRLGDFYYTKIVINSINIQYENPTWDLNPEGIGVMPMFAKVSMDFVFLGGSDLAGPISRLQNAVSFNYYANTGVYDNRAEMVQYDPDGNGHEVKFKPYSYPDMIHGLDNYKVNKEESNTEGKK